MGGHVDSNRTGDAVTGAGQGLHWAVAAPFNRNADEPWLTYAVEGHHSFTIVARPGEERSWHNRKRNVSGVRDWKDLQAQARAAVRAANPDGGVVTVFPQLAALVGAQKRMGRFDGPILAWFFNTNLYPGTRGRLARTSLSAVDKFVVHTEHERGIYAEWLDIPVERFEFVPLQFVPARTAGCRGDGRTLCLRDRFGLS